MQFKQLNKERKSLIFQLGFSQYLRHALCYAQHWQGGQKCIPWFNKLFPFLALGFVLSQASHTQDTSLLMDFFFLF